MRMLGSHRSSIGCPQQHKGTTSIKRYQRRRPPWRCKAKTSTGNGAGAQPATDGGSSSDLASDTAAGGYNFAPVCRNEEHECDATMLSFQHSAAIQPGDAAGNMRLRHRARIMWAEGGAARVLIVKKPGVPEASAVLAEMAEWLEARGVEVFVEPSVQAEFPHLSRFEPHRTTVDFGITLGGDGTVLYLSSLFDRVDAPLPPVICFAMGTLGFMTNFDVAEYQQRLSRVLAANRQPLYCTLRTRKRCQVLSADWEPRQCYHVLNECVIDRGSFPGAVYLEIFIDGAYVTAAEADGLIVSTPSGSTAYSMSAGGAMVAPSVPCTLLTPLSPLSLSFRPLVVPEAADLVVRVPPYARAHARASFDGKHPQRVPRGGGIHITTSRCPLPLINIGSYDSDWYEAITQKLHWNQAIRGQRGQQAPGAAAVAKGGGGVSRREEDGRAGEAAAAGVAADRSGSAAAASGAGAAPSQSGSTYSSSGPDDSDALLEPAAGFTSMGD